MSSHLLVTRDAIWAAQWADPSSRWPSRPHLLRTWAVRMISSARTVCEHNSIHRGSNSNWTSTRHRYLSSRRIITVDTVVTVDTGAILRRRICPSFQWRGISKSRSVFWTVRILNNWTVPGFLMKFPRLSRQSSCFARSFSGQILGTALTTIRWTWCSRFRTTTPNLISKPTTTPAPQTTPPPP